MLGCEHACVITCGHEVVNEKEIFTSDLIDCSFGTLRNFFLKNILCIPMKEPNMSLRI